VDALSSNYSFGRGLSQFEFTAHEANNILSMSQETDDTVIEEDGSNK
jgi:hypothetical protein